MILILRIDYDIDFETVCGDEFKKVKLKGMTLKINFALILSIEYRERIFGFFIGIEVKN